MKASEIFSKTAKGQSEVESRTDALSMKERRVLILVNGENNAAKLRQLSLCENIVEILETLVSGGFIEAQASESAEVPAPAASPDLDETETEIDTETVMESASASDLDSDSDGEVGAREFMCNTLLTFANRVRVAELIEKINSVKDTDSLKQLVKPWYMALSETPGGMYQADDLRDVVNKMIANEETSGLR